MFKRITALLLSAVFASAMLTSFAYAQEEETAIVSDEYNEEIEFLEAIGIIKGYKEGAFDKNGYMTRAELAMLSVYSLGLGEENVSDMVSYIDVPSGYWAEKFISIATNSDIMVGHDGMFYPDKAVGAEEVAKVMVQLLGYSYKANAMGGYPTGYMAAARELDITDGVDFKGEFTRGKATKMLYNMLHTEPLEIDYLKTDSAAYKKSDRSFMEVTLDIVPDEGVIKSNHIASLWGDAAAAENELMIEDEKFVISNSAYADFLGREVEYYYKDNDDGYKRELLYLRPANDDSKTYEIKSRDILKDNSSFSAKTFVYLDSRERIIKEDIEDAYIFINGKIPDVSVTKADLAPIDGKVVLLDDDNDGKIDLVFTEEWQSVVAAIANVGNETILDKLGGGNINCKNDTSKRVEIKKDGKTVLLSAIKEWDILLISESRDKEFMRIEASSKTVSGSSDGYSDEDIIRINGEEYEINPIFDKNALVMGETYTFRLDSEGRVAYLELETLTGGGYGYLFTVRKDEEKGNLRFRILTESGELKVFESADKIRYNQEGKLENEVVYNKLPLDGAEANTLVVYKTNSEGYLTQVSFPKEDSEYITPDYPMAKRSYSKLGNIFGLYEAEGFAVDTNAPVFYIVKGNPEESKITSAESFVDKKEYTIAGYNAGENMTPKVMVQTVEQGAKGDMNVTWETPVGVITKIRTGLNAQEDIVPIITLISGGQELELVCKERDKINTRAISYPSNKQSVISFDNFKKGDVVYYDRDYMGEVDAIVRVLPSATGLATDKEAEWIISRGWSGERIFGSVERMSGYFTEVSAGGEKYLYSLQGASVTVYDVKEDYIYAGGNEEMLPRNLSPNEYSKIFMKVNGGKVSDVVIFNNWK